MKGLTHGTKGKKQVVQSPPKKILRPCSIQVVNRRNLALDWKVKQNYIYIGSESQLARLARSPLYNPFKSKKGCVESRQSAMESFEWQFLRMIKRTGTPERIAFLNLLKFMETQSSIFLVCACSPKLCHGDVIKFHLERVRSKYA